MSKYEKVLINKKTMDETIDDYIYHLLKKNNDLKREDYSVEFPFTKEQFTQRVKEIKDYMKQLDILKAKPILKQRTDEWFNARKEMLTASDTFDGIRKVKNLVRKKALGIDERISGKALYWGTTFEPVALDIYANIKQGIYINEFGLIPHDSMKYYGASPDGITDMGIMVEIKCPFSRKIIPNEVPVKYMAQMQGQMAVCNLKECDYCEYKFTEITAKEYLNTDHNNVVCGMITEKEDGNFIYSNLDGEPSEEYIRQMELNHKNRIYWMLEEVQIIRVLFNEVEWNNYYMPKINEFWIEVECFDEEIYQKTKKPHAKKQPVLKFIEESDDDK
eukprot:768657-Hanusia_phi.AAC.5